MEILGVFAFFVGLFVVVFVVGGLSVGWYAFFQIRGLRSELEALRASQRTPAPQPEPVSEPIPESVPEPVFHETTLELPPEVPFPEEPAAPVLKAPPTEQKQPVRGWEKRFLENWTGLVGLVVITLGLGFLAAYAATVLNPLGRALLITGGAALLMAAGLALPRRKPRWTRWGYWLQSLAAAVFLFACLGSGGVPGVAWVTHPLAALGLLILGIVVNITLASIRKRQPYLTLHVILSLVALAVPSPDPLILLFLSLTAFTGVALAWFQKWTYNRAVTVLVFQVILALSRLRSPADDLSFQIGVVAASALLAALVHFASYRRLEQGAAWSRPAFLTHLVNAGAAAVTCALWAPRFPIATVAVLGALVVALALLASRARATKTSWLYRTDRVLALAVAAIVLVLNPLGALPLLLSAGFALLVLVFAWTAFREADPLLTQIGDVLVMIALLLLPLAALALQIGADRIAWVWGGGSCFLVGIAAGTFFALRAGKLGRWWHDTALAVLPATFAFPLLAMLGASSPFPAVSLGWVLLAPWVGLALLRARLASAALSWGWAGTGWLISVVAWATWIALHGYGHADPWLTLASGGPIWLLTTLPLFFGARPGESHFTATFLVAIAGLAVWLSTALVTVAPALAPACWLVLMLAVAALVRPLALWDPRLSKFALWLLAAGFAVARLAADPWSAPAVGIAFVDGGAVVVMVLLAVLKSTGPGLFWEMALAWGLWFFWIDLPREAFPLLVALLAVGTLAAGRFYPRARRLDWYSVALFAVANLLAVLTDVVWVKSVSLGTLAVFLVLESLVPLLGPAEDSLGQKFRPYRRYVLVLLQGVAWAAALPSLLDPLVLTFGWSVEAALLFLLAVVWKDALFKNASFVGLAACLGRLLLVDLGNSDVLTKAVTFLSVGGLMVGMNVLYLWSQNRRNRENTHGS